MTPISEKTLDRMLFEYCEKEPAHPFVFKPQSEQSPPPVSVFRRYKVLAFAATVVLVAGMSLSVYFFFGNKSAVPVAPSPTSSTAQPSEKKAATDAVKSPSSPTGSTDPTASKSSTSPSSSAAPSVTEKKEGTVTPTLPGKGPAEPTESPKPTVSPTRPAETTSPTTSPTRPVETTSPTVVPTDEPWERPTEAPQPTESPCPTEPSPPVGEVVFTGSFPSTDFRGGVLYCRIYEHGKLLGDPDLYSYSHIADYTVHNGRVYAEYYPFFHGIDLQPGIYKFFFYDAAGVDWYVGQIQVYS